VVFFVGQALGLYPVAFVGQLDNIVYDARLALTAPRTPIAQRFREYVPPEVVAKMERDPAKYDAPRNAELTILFSDVRGFSAIAEALAPEALREYINEYLTTMSEIIRNRHRGTLDKYIGDAIMAFWSAPLADARHARNAVLAALEMQSACEC